MRVFGLALYINHISLEGDFLNIEGMVTFYQGREVTLAELETLRQTLTQYYIDQGYINSGAVIAEGAYHDGELTINIIPGKISEVRLKGLGRLREGYIKNRLLPDPEQPFDLYELKENYRRLLTDPLIAQMRGRIIPGERLGQSILDIDVTRARPYHLVVSGNNQRAPSIGAEAFNASGALRNLTGLGDLLEFSFTHSSGSKRYAGGYTLPISDWGTSAFFHFDEGDASVVEAPFNGIGIKSKVHILEGGFSQIVRQNVRDQLTLGALLTSRINETLGPLGPLSYLQGVENPRTQATVVRFFQEYQHRWRDLVGVFRSTFNVGIDVFGATSQPDPKIPGSEFFAWLGQGQMAWRFMDNGSYALLRGNVQLSDSALLPLERIAVGGFYSVRGYRENQLVRDQGYSAALELHYALIDRVMLDRNFKLWMVPFMDYGAAWNVSETKNTLHSVGLGLEAQFKPLQAALYYGYALNTPNPRQHGDLQDSGLHFQVSLEVF